MTDWRKFDEPTPLTFIGEIGEIGEIGVVDFVIVEAVVEETAQERAWRKWGMCRDEQRREGCDDKNQAIEKTPRAT